MKYALPVLAVLSVSASAQQKSNLYALPDAPDFHAAFFQLASNDGKTLVKVNMDTGEVTLTGDPNEAAKVFWTAVKQNVPKCDP